MGGGEPLARAMGGGGKPHTAAISDSRCECGLPTVGVHEQVLPAGPGTSGIVSEEGTATKHHPLLLSLPWECIHTAVATAKGSGHCLHQPECHCHFPRPSNQEKPALPPCQSSLCQGPSIQALATSFAHYLHLPEAHIGYTTVHTS